MSLLPCSAAAPAPDVDAPAPPSDAAGVDKSGRRIQQMFGEIAPRYDLLNHVLSGGVDFYWRRRTVQLVPPEGDAPILDLCTGTGDLAFAYARAAGAHVRVVGADFTRPMLVLAHQKQSAGRQRTGRVEFVEADAQQLPFPDDQFQIVSVAFGLRNIASTLGGLREMVRVAAPGGRVAVLEFSQPRSRPFNVVYQRYFRTVLPRIGQWISGSRQAAYDYLPQSVAEFPSGPAMCQLLEQAGLESVQSRSFTFGIASLYWGRKPKP